MVEVRVRALVADMDQARARRLQSDHQIEEGRFAAARLADDCHHLAWRNGEIEAIDRHDGLPGRGLAKNLAQAAHFDRRGAIHARHRNMCASARATIVSSRNRSATKTSVQANTSATEKSSCATDS